jgi:PLP dependent protein
MSNLASISLKLAQINKSLADKAKLIAVSKTKPLSDIMAAYQTGQRHFGENKVQELLDKALALKETCPEIKWHFIGHLQTNKINMLLKVPNLVSIHSIDSIELLHKLLSKKIDTPIGIFLQVNTSLEEEKAGFENKSEVLKALEIIGKQQAFFFQGLMTIGKIRTSDFENDAKKCFIQLVELKHDIEQTFSDTKVQLSMGMSSDYHIALKLGSDWIRIGSEIFGMRSL